MQLFPKAIYGALALSFSSPLPANEHVGLGAKPVEGVEVVFDG
ncbi:MAG: hypothetical protein P8H96_08300 [Akkermansiaceae bacterium]|nr:hypothetical protein [Akkermansiaceae bacterium]